MNKFRLTLLCATLLYNLSAQHKVSFGIEATPTLSWISANIKNAQSDGVSFGIGYGISYNQMVTENWGYGSGLTMNHNTYKIKYTEAVNFETYDAIHNLPAQSAVEYRTQSMELPLGLVFKSRQIGYLSIVGHTGLFANVTIKTKVAIPSVNVDGETAKKEVNPFGAGYYFGTGIYYSLGGSTAVKAMLTFSNALTDLTNDRNHKEDQINTYRLGLSIGIMF